MINPPYAHSEWAGKIIGCAMEVHKVLGNGFQKVIYQRALALGRLTQVNLVNPELAVRRAKNNRSLRTLGVTVRKTIDCLIATYCLEHDLDLLHKDADNDVFEQHLGLRVEHA